MQTTLTAPNPWTRARWSPYLVGALIGVLSWVTFLFMDQALGASTTLVRAAGMVTGAFSEEAVRGNAYYSKYLVGKPGFDWQFALVVLLPVGAWIAARLSNSDRAESVPELWRSRFGDSKSLRYLAAFGGGALMLFGARLAGGCTSGHAISGNLQLAVSGWIFTAALFVGGIVTAMSLYHKRS